MVENLQGVQINELSFEYDWIPIVERRKSILRDFDELTASDYVKLDKLRKNLRLTNKVHNTYEMGCCANEGFCSGGCKNN